MPGWLVAAIWLAVFAVIALIVSTIIYRASKKPNSYFESVYKWPLWIAPVLGLLTGLCILFSSMTTVPTKEFGIVTEFGRPIAAYDNGFHWKAPWDDITTIDAAIQTDNHTDAKDGEGCVNIRIAYQANACINVSVSWRIEDGAADALFQNYRDFSNIKNNLVTRALTQALTVEFGNYDPLAIDANGDSLQSLTAISTKLTADLQQNIGAQINVQNVVLGTPKWSDNIQSKIDALQAQIAQTRIAAQAVLTNEKQAEANQKLADSLSNDPNVLVSKCLDIIESNKVTLPAGFTCWPGGSSAVVVPSSK